MPRTLDPRLDVLPAAQRAIWDQLRPAPRASFVLYGGTAVALHLGHRQSIDFDFFRAGSLDKVEIRQAFPFVDRAAVLQDRPDTYVVSADIPEGPVKVSFFGGLDLGRVNDPLITREHALLVASLDDLMATKLKAILDLAEAKDYRDIAQMLLAGVSLPLGLSASRRSSGCFEGSRPKSCVRSASSATAISGPSQGRTGWCCAMHEIAFGICPTSS